MKSAIYTLLSLLCLCTLSCVRCVFVSSVQNTSKLEKNTCAILSMNVRRGGNAHWHIPSYHNATLHEAAGNKSQVIFQINLYGVCRGDSMKGNLHGGIAILVAAGDMNIEIPRYFYQKQAAITQSLSATRKRFISCYFSTSHKTFGDIVDRPYTVGVAALCPIYSDWLLLTSPKQRGNTNIIEPLTEKDFDDETADELYESLQTHSRSFTLFFSPATHTSTPPATRISFRYNPTVSRSPFGDRPHAVCTVQTFSNPVSGAKLFLFVRYHLSLGFTVIVYDRLGVHAEELSLLLPPTPSISGTGTASKTSYESNGGELIYFPHTALQLANPDKYSAEHAGKQVIVLCLLPTYPLTMSCYVQRNEFRHYSGSHPPEQLADTADLDSDKQLTYDMARAEFSHLASVFFVDLDEFVYCPPHNHIATGASVVHTGAPLASAPHDIATMRQELRGVLDKAVADGVPEVRFPRVAFAGKKTLTTGGSTVSTSMSGSHQCMRGHYDAARLQLLSVENSSAALLSPSLVRDMFACWTGAALNNNPGKSCDMRSPCPFHWVHWSCHYPKDAGHPSERPGRERCFCRVRLVDMIWAPPLTLDLVDGKRPRGTDVIRQYRCVIAHFNDENFHHANMKYGINYTEIEDTPANPLATLWS